MAAALLAGLRRFPRVQGILLALLLGFAVGRHFQTNAIYRRDWETQRVFFWQLAWRAPALQPGTTLLTNDLPLTTFSDNSSPARSTGFTTPTNCKTWKSRWMDAPFRASTAA